MLVGRPWADVQRLPVYHTFAGVSYPKSLSGWLELLVTINTIHPLYWFIRLQYYTRGEAKSVSVVAKY